MKLIFLGRGAAFNPKEGNTSAFFFENKDLFLIDCGESIFERLILNELLNDIDSINIMITHTHSDHIGSLGSLVMYFYYILHKPLNIVLPKGAKYLSNIVNILNSFGCTKEMYNFIDEDSLDNKFKTFDNIRYIETRHCIDLDCYGILFNTKNGIVYYSGDTNDDRLIKYLIDTNEQIDKLYIDTTSANYPGNVHLFIGILNDIIPEELKNHVYCMHLNNDKCIDMASEYGFNVVENVK